MKRVFFVVLVSLLSALALAQPSGPHWTVQKQKDAFSDENTSYMFLLSEGASAFSKTAIVIRCKGNNAYEIFVLFDEYLNDGPVPVKWRFASKSPETGTWDISTDGTSVFVPDNLLRDFRQQLSVYSLAIQATDYDGQSYVLKFDSGQGGNFATSLGQLPCVVGR